MKTGKNILIILVGIHTGNHIGIWNFFGGRGLQKPLCLPVLLAVFVPILDEKGTLCEE